MEPIQEYEPAADELSENALNIFPYADTFEPYTRAPRKQTNFPNFPPGFSPFDDTRDPGADPTAYPSPATKHFENFLGRSRVNAEGWATGTLHIWESLFWETPVESLWNSWNCIPNVPGLVKRTTIATTTPFICLYLYARIIDLWRHGTGLLFYTFYYLAAVKGQANRTKCWRVLREGHSCRFTVTSQFWFRRGCEGSADGFVARGRLMDKFWDATVALFFDTFFVLPRGILHAVVLIIFWVFLGGFGCDALNHAGKYPPFLWKRRIWPLIKDTFDWKFIRDFLLIPWLHKMRQVWISIWAVFLGFNLHAFIPEGQPNAGQGVRVEHAAELLEEDSDDLEEGGGNAVFDPNPDPAQFRDEDEGSSDSNDHDFGAGAGAPVRRGHFMVRGHPIPPDLVAQGLLLNRGEFILQGGNRDVADERGSDSASDEEDEEFDIDVWRVVHPTAAEFVGWEAENQARVGDIVLPDRGYGAYHRGPDNEEELDMPDPRQRDTGAVQGDKPTYEEGSEGSEGSGLSALLEALGIEGEDAEEEFLRREIEVQKGAREIGTRGDATPSTMQ